MSLVESIKCLMINEGDLNHLILIMDAESTHIDVTVESLKVVYNIVIENEHQLPLLREDSSQLLKYY